VREDRARDARDVEGAFDRRHAVIRVGLVGARGHTGAELVALIEGHPRLALAYASSRKDAGRGLAEVVPGARTDLQVVAPDPADVAARGLDAVVLALPNGEAKPYVDALGDRGVVVDLSADHRFDDAWAYGLPERTRATLRGAKRIANPGCYATGMQLALGPIVDVLAAPPVCFGVSGYSGAGTTPSPRNDPEKLRDNLMPYSLVGHVHEREVARGLGRDVVFVPHVAPFFRGITLTISAAFAAPIERAALRARYEAAYAGEPLVAVVDDVPLDDVPLVRDAAGKHGATIGAFAVADDGRRAVIVATLDNLLKGAATQAVQNLNLALGFDELAGIPRG
jgi:N-acetyl-gamma-glutamyl-phosphate reductase